MTTQPNHCPTCNMPLDDRQLQEIIEQAIAKNFDRQARKETMIFSASDMAGDVVDAIRKQQQTKG